MVLITELLPTCKRAHTTGEKKNIVTKKSTQFDPTKAHPLTLGYPSMPTQKRPPCRPWARSCSLAGRLVRRWMSCRRVSTNVFSPRSRHGGVGFFPTVNPFHDTPLLAPPFAADEIQSVGTTKKNELLLKELGTVHLHRGLALHHHHRALGHYH